jgi:hypothetical protein
MCIIGHVPAEVVVAGVDDEDVALADLGPLLDHLRGVDLVVAGGVGEVHDDARPDGKLVERQLGNVLAGGEKVDLAVEAGAQVVRVGKQLPIGPTYPNCTTRCRFHSESIAQEDETGKKLTLTKSPQGHRWRNPEGLLWTLYARTRSTQDPSLFRFVLWLNRGCRWMRDYISLIDN